MSLVGFFSVWLVGLVFYWVRFGLVGFLRLVFGLVGPKTFIFSGFSSKKGP